MKYVVIGNSAAGLFAVEEIRRRDPEGEITVLTADNVPYYSRCLTTYYLAGDIPVERLYLRPDDFAPRLGLEIAYGAEVTGLDVQSQVVLTRDGREWPYDKLLLATGASANTLAVPGADLPEVFTLRHMSDARAIDALIPSCREAVVVGGGLVSLKSAYALLKRGLKVTVVVSSTRILSQMLDTHSAGHVARHLRNHGMNIILGADVAGINGREHVESVTLADGRELNAQLVITGKGVRPNTGYLAGSPIAVGQGIKVNDRLETNVPNVYAAGDVVESWDRVLERQTVNATWPNATTQGRIAGANMAGANEQYLGSMGLNSVDFFGLSVISAGVVKTPALANGGSAWQVKEQWKPTGKGIPAYQRLVFKDNILKGYVLLGDTGKAGVLTGLIREGKPYRSRVMES